MGRLRRLLLPVAVITLVAPGAHRVADAIVEAQSPASASASDDPIARGNALLDQATAAWRQQHFDDAERNWMAALAVFTEAGNAERRAFALRNLTFLPRLSVDDRLALLDEALALVRGANSTNTEGVVRHQIADFEYIRGDFGAALNNLNQAIALLDRPGPQVNLARALTSRGRLYRSMGRFSAALADQERAAELLVNTTDLVGASQAYNGAAITFSWMGRYDEAGRLMARSIDLARASGNARRLSGALAQAAAIASSAGRAEAALALLAEADLIPVPDVDRSLVEGAWAQSLLALGRLADALARVDRALLTPDRNIAEDVARFLALRAEILDALGRRQDALESSSRSVALLERDRARLVPADDARRGFMEVRRGTLSAHVRRLARAGRHEEALEAAERARARAFLDLLATTDLRGELPASQTGLPEPAAVTRSTSVPDPSPLSAIIASRRASAPRPAPPPEPPISSVAVAEPPTLASIRAQAARLGGHVLTYWTTSDAVLIWVVAPDGRVSSARSPVTPQALGQLVDRTLVDVVGATRTATAPSASAPPPSVPSRLTFGRDATRAHRDLYRLLIAPVRGSLPAGTQVTIVPHGPLFRLSFAALISPNGRYLIEDHPVHYAPSVNALAFTANRRHAADGPALIVADPELAAAGGDADPLPRLPGAAREGRAIAAIIGADRASLLTGGRARERQVREAASTASVLHFATHGVIRDDEPFDSYLALAGESPEGHDDGRLTTGEVYGLRLTADLVVLGACRTATGPITGDGIVGLTRGFFAAGAPSVIASLWDLPDSVTASIFPAFYTTWARTSSKAESLRQAQLAMIRQLRAGRVSVDTPAGRFVVDEHPALWAGLVLVGEP